MTRIGLLTHVPASQTVTWREPGKAHPSAVDHCVTPTRGSRECPTTEILAPYCGITGRELWKTISRTQVVRVPVLPL